MEVVPHPPVPVAFLVMVRVRSRVSEQWPVQSAIDHDDHAESVHESGQPGTGNSPTSTAATAAFCAADRSAACLAVMASIWPGQKAAKTSASSAVTSALLKSRRMATGKARTLSLSPAFASLFRPPVSTEALMAAAEAAGSAAHWSVVSPPRLAAVRPAKAAAGMAAMPAGVKPLIVDLTNAAMAARVTLPAPAASTNSACRKVPTGLTA
mmetsp:Transcript_7335/g.26212  ORF Transcript_7335/g.26212 Transcript_7335/m.26212 type:complete len:210 (+) Transcript_7335:215-844(+)